MNAAAQAAIEKAMSLSIWQAPHQAALLGGGITNFNVMLTDQGKRYVVRVGQDIPLHQIMRFNELAVHRAAQEIGVAPAVVHAEPGILVLEFVDGGSLDESAVRNDDMLARIIPMVKRCHSEGMQALRGPVLTFWVFHVLRNYAASLREGGSTYQPMLEPLLQTASQLEQAVGPVQLVLGHNDLLAANVLDDGTRLWLLDWEYGGFNSPLFDLAGLASNNELSEAQECAMLESYFETQLTQQLAHQYHAMKCASLLRETMWSMVSEIHSEIDFDYAVYTEKNLTRFKAALSDFQSM
ncbi:choline kinase [Rhodobacterales bacterium 56_14_T64]|nr:choline kinase [Rhodobacterales bacterium 56_14_T64]